MTKIHAFGRMLGLAFLVLFACYGLHGAVMEIHHTLAQEIGIPERPGTPVTTPMPMTRECTPDKGEFTIPNPLPGGGWTSELRFYDAGDARPGQPDSKASGVFDKNGCGAIGGQKQGYDEVRVEITRNGLGVGVEVDVIRHAKEGE